MGCPMWGRLSACGGLAVRHASEARALYQLLKPTYYEVQRNNAKVRNYLAESVVDGAKK